MVESSESPADNDDTEGADEPEDSEDDEDTEENEVSEESIDTPPRKKAKTAKSESKRKKAPAQKGGQTASRAKRGSSSKPRKRRRRPRTPELEHKPYPKAEMEMMATMKQEQNQTLVRYLLERQGILERRTDEKLQLKAQLKIAQAKQDFMLAAVSAGIHVTQVDQPVTAAWPAQASMEGPGGSASKALMYETPKKH